MYVENRAIIYSIIFRSVHTIVTLECREAYECIVLDESNCFNAFYFSNGSHTYMNACAEKGMNRNFAEPNPFVPMCK